MPAALHLVTAAGFAAMMVGAGFEDIRRLVIPNELILGLVALWAVHLAVTPGTTLPAGAAAVGGALGVFLIGALLFSRGIIGGGDVKLLAAAALWSGAARLPALLLLTGLFGGVASLLVLSPLGRIGAARRCAAVPPEVVAGSAGPPVPYGAAIAGAALFVALPPQLG